MLPRQLFKSFFYTFHYSVFFVCLFFFIYSIFFSLSPISFWYTNRIFSNPRIIRKQYLIFEYVLFIHFIYRDANTSVCMSNYDDRCEFIIRNCTQATHAVAHLFAAHYLRSSAVYYFTTISYSHTSHSKPEWLEYFT